MRRIATIPTCPDDFEGHNSGAQIVVHPSGRFLYSSNRGHNSIAVFTIDQESGRPRLMNLVSTRGDTPRNFNIDPNGQFLVVANVNSNNLVSFRIDQATGQLAPTGNVANCDKPVCVMFCRDVCTCGYALRHVMESRAGAVGDRPSAVHASGL